MVAIIAISRVINTKNPINIFIKFVGVEGFEPSKP